MALFDYLCPQCALEPNGGRYEDVHQDIGSDALPTCPNGHPWKRQITGVRIDRGFRGPASVSPQMETFWETGDPNLAFPPGKPDDDAFTLDDLTDHQIETNQR